MVEPSTLPTPLRIRFWRSAEVLLVDTAGIGIECLAHTGCHPDYFALGAARAHHAHRPERFVGHAEAPSCHEEVVDVPGKEATVRDPEGTVFLVGREEPVFGL